MLLKAGTRALVTGASRGIGRALCSALAERGAVLGLVARSGEELDALAAALPGDGHRPLPCDVGDRAAVEAAVEAFAADGLQLVVANAGIARYGTLLTAGVEPIEAMVRINQLGTVYTVAAALPALLRAEAGHIVVVSSGAGLRSFPGAAGYGATKAAQRMFASALRHELAGTSVSLTTVYPGEIATGLHDHERDRLPEWYRGGSRATSPEALAAAVLTAVEQDRRELHHPRVVRLLGALEGISPALADAFLRRLRGSSAAPRR